MEKNGTSMEIVGLEPGKGADVLRTLDDGLVLMEHFTGLPAGRVRPMNHGIFILCTAGKAQFEYDGQPIQLSPNDLFLFFAHGVLENFMSSPDFDCREVWFSRGALWDMNMYGKSSLSDLVTLKQRPKVALADADAAKLGTYFQLLCQNLRESARSDNREIVHSLFSTFILEALAMMRRTRGETAEAGGGKLHGKLLADRFVELVEQSDGRIRRVEEFAAMLNVTPKYLSKLLMKTMHRKPSVIVALFTLKAIENRLRFTDLTMQQIADDLHFSSASSFGKFVKEHTGMTPLEFRQKYYQNK
ncbi:MAG: helix-turn-helix domain-containing protein [Bacteroidales bacterium]|nr:helix-turn-helix domain-containing protein [Bacteroidales bacterium]